MINIGETEWWTFFPKASYFSTFIRSQSLESGSKHSERKAPPVWREQNGYLH